MIDIRMKDDLCQHKKDLLLRALIVWAGIFVLAFTNGALRELFIKRFIQEPWAHHLSAVTGILIISAYCSCVFSFMRIQTKKESYQTGLMWFVLTVLTETFLLNRCMSGLSWKEVAETYNIFKGELWPLVVIAIGVLPPFLWWRKIKAAGQQ